MSQCHGPLLLIALIIGQLSAAPASPAEKPRKCCEPRPLTNWKSASPRTTCGWPPDPIIPIEGRLAVDFGQPMPEGSLCRGQLYEVAPHRTVSSPATGEVHVGHEGTRTYVAIQTDIPLEVRITGAFAPAVDDKAFVLHAEPLGTVGGGEPVLICVEARKCSGAIVDPRPWIVSRKDGRWSASGH